MSPDQIVVLVGAILGSSFLTAIVTTRSQARKVKADTQKVGVEAAQILSGASIAMIEPMEKQIARLSAQVDAAEFKAEQLNIQVEKMAKTLKWYNDKYGPPTGELEPIR